MITQNFIFGRSRKSAASVTATTYKGLNVIKAKPLTVANPRTPKQLNTRKALANLVKQFRLFPDLFRKAFAQAPAPMSEYNQFVKENMASARIFETVPGLLLDATKFHAAKGTITPLTLKTVTYDPDTKRFNIQWDNVLKGNQTATMKVGVLVLGEERGIHYAAITPRGVTDPAYNFDYTNDDIINNDLFVYVFLYDEAERKASNSVRMAAALI